MPKKITGTTRPRPELPESAWRRHRPLATVPEIADHYGVPEKTVRDWHHRQVEIGPLMFRIGKYLRARWEDIDRYDAEKVGGAA